MNVVIRRRFTNNDSIDITFKFTLSVDGLVKYITAIDNDGDNEISLNDLTPEAERFMLEQVKDIAVKKIKEVLVA